MREAEGYGQKWLKWEEKWTKVQQVRNFWYVGLEGQGKVKIKVWYHWNKTKGGSIRGEKSESGKNKLIMCLKKIS